MSDPVICEIEDGIATITLNCPNIKNALTEKVSDGIVDALNKIEETGARCVIIEGAENSFSAGGDIDAMISELENKKPLYKRVQDLIQTLSRTIKRVYEFHLPTIAKLEGSVFGAGANLALACDIQLASSTAKISFGFRQVGLGIDAGTSFLLPRVVGENIAKELIYTGELIQASRAKELGLVNRVYAEDDFEEKVSEFIEPIANGPTVALSNSKRLIRQGFESTFEQALTNESAAQAAVYQTEDHKEGVEAFRNQRKPDFQGE